MYEESALHSRALFNVVLCWGGFSSGWDTGAGVQLNILAITRNISTIRQGISAYRQSKTKEIPYIPRNMW